MDVRRAAENELGALTEIAAALQTRAERHIAFLGTDAASIAAEVVDDNADWAAMTSVAVEEEVIVGWLMGSVDVDMGRVWWWGPFVDTDDPGDWALVADALYDHASTLLPRNVDQEELGPDGRHADLRAWAAGRGFDTDPGSAVLTLPSSCEPAKPAKPVANISIRAADPTDAPRLSVLHDELFAGSHTTGASLATSADDRRIRLVAEVDGTFAGYVAVELELDGSGYIDFLGTRTDMRRRGIAAGLIVAAIDELRLLGAGDVHLTVRETNHAARALYDRLGFVEERIIVPMRRGFRLR